MIGDIIGAVALFAIAYCGFVLGGVL